MYYCRYSDRALPYIKTIYPLVDKMTYDDWDYTVFDDFRTKGLGRVAHGAERGVIIPKTENFVIKFGIYGTYGAYACMRERRFFSEATQQGIGKYFATYYGAIRHGRMLFHIFERCDTLLGDAETFPIEYIGYNSSFTYAFVRFIENPQERRALDFFLRQRDIADLHFQNIAINTDGNVKLIDYAGYNNHM